MVFTEKHERQIDGKEVDFDFDFARLVAMISVIRNPSFVVDRTS